MSRILKAAGALVDTIKINALTREDRDGRTFWIKRRTWAARPIMACANCFFSVAGNPVVVDRTPHLWENIPKMWITTSV